MNAADKRILSAITLLFIFALALYLRLYGIDWAFKDKVGTPHPDERHYEACANDMNPQGLTPEERQLPWREQVRLFYERNLRVDPAQPFRAGTPGLRPVNYNYGTLPLHLYMLYRMYLAEQVTAPAPGTESAPWVFLSFADWLSLAAILFVLVLGIQLFRAIRRDFREMDRKKVPWYKDPRPLLYFFPSMILPFVGLLLVVLFPSGINDFTGYNPQNASILLIGRILTAWAGAFTVLLAYLIGRDAYNRTAGLLAAAILATAMLHVQTSHFATVDVIVGFWSTAAVYCFLKISQKPRLFWYLLGAACVGFGVATKWSGVTLPGILLVAHAAVTWGDERHGKAGRWIHTFWLILAGLIMLHFFKAAGSIEPTLDVTMAAFRDFYWGYKWIFLVFIVWFGILSLVLLGLRNHWHDGKVGWFWPAVAIYSPWLWLLLSIPVGVFCFYLAEPMAYFDAPVFARNMAEQYNTIVRGAAPGTNIPGVPYTLQFRNTPGVFYYLSNLFYPSLDWITAFFVIAGTLYALVRVFVRGTAANLVLAAWVIPSLFLYGTFWAKFPRYLDTILPVMAVFGGWLITELGSVRPYFYNPAWPSASVGQKRFVRNFGWVGGGLAILCGLVYGGSYITIYNQPHTYVQARNLITQFAAPGSRIVQNSWDEGIGVPISQQMEVHTRYMEEPDTDRRAQYFAEMLENTDYILFPSKRGYGSTLRNPDLFPVTNPFMRALFAEQLGFRVAKVITNWPKFLWWEFRTDEEDETADIYDHPKVIIFEKTRSLTADQYKEIILFPPDWVGEVSESEILRLTDGYPVYYEPPTLPVFRWWLIVEIFGVMAFVLLFPLCPILPDRGYAIAKVVGLALFSWACWFLASVHLFPLSRAQMLFVFAVFLGAAGYAAQRRKGEMAAYLKQKWPLLLGYELLFLAIWMVFLAIKVYHPSAIWGEKPMNFSFINAIYRTADFPPEDPWISDYGVNYYYYGQAVFSIVGRFIGLEPAYFFNIAGTSVTALAGLSVFSLVYALCLRLWVSFLAAYLCLFAGHLVSYGQWLRFQMEKPDIGFGEFFLTALSYVQFKILSLLAMVGVYEFNSDRLAVLQNSAQLFRSYIGGFFSVISLTFWSLFHYLGLAKMDMNDPETQKFFHQTYDRVFWPSGHNVVFGTAANEFPSWMHLFLDFHAHMLVVPFVFAYMTLLYVYFARPRKQTSSAALTGLVFFLALLLGSVTCINTWDLPACMIALLMVGALKFRRESDLMGGAVRTTWLSPAALQSWLSLPVVPVLSVAVLSVLLMYPFHFHFVPRANSVRFMTEGQTPLLTYLGLWGQILVPILVGIVLFAVVRRDGRVSLPRTVLAVMLFLGIWIAAMLVTAYNPFHFPLSPVPSPGEPPRPPMNFAVAGLFIPFLLMLFWVLWQRGLDSAFAFACLLGFLGLGISMGIEFFYVWEGWSIPMHRYNTVFKFNLQVWHYLSVFASLCLLYVWRLLNAIGANAGRYFAPVTRTLFAAVCVALLLPTVPFAVLAPLVVTQTGGAESRDAKGTIPSLDGFSWLHKDHYESYAAIQWFNRFVPGSTNIIELVDKEYYDFARFCTNTGLPALLGWPHHVGERVFFNNEKEPRRQAANLVYTSTDKDQVRTILGRYGVEYLIFGELEMNRRRGERDVLPPLGPETLARFETWGDFLSLVYRVGDTSIFRVDKNLNRAYGLQQAPAPAEPPLPPAMRPPDPTVSMYDGVSQGGQVIFAEPRGLAADDQGQVYVADSFNHKLQVFTPDGARAWQVGKQGTEKEQFKEPNDVALDPTTGNIYITDTWNQRVVLYAPTGEEVGATAFGLFGPRGVAYHPALNMVYITDTGNDQVVLMTPDGQEIGRWGVLQGGEGDNDFREPVGIDVMPDNNVIVVDGMNHRLKIYTPDGNLVRFFPIQSDTPGTNFEGHVACDKDGTVYLTDPNEGSVHVYTPNGELKEKIKHDVNGLQLAIPLGIAVVPDGPIYVSDRSLNRIMRIR